MARDIACFPAEVIEKLLLFLQGEDLIRASQVCWQWACIAHRIMSKLNIDTFSPELLEDISIDVDEKSGADPVTDVFRESIQNLEHKGDSCEVELEHGVSTIEADGTRVYVGDASGNLLVYELLDLSVPFLSAIASAVLPDDGPVMHLGLMKRHSLLVASSPSNLYFFSTGALELCSSSLTEITRGLSLRVYKNFVGITEGNSKIKIFKVSSGAKGVVDLEVFTQFETPCGIYRWKIWNNQVLCVLKTGSVLVWDLSVNNCCHVSEPYHELRYQNPCWLFQRYVLCSSELSRNLLCRYIYMMPTCPAAYWHISCGPSYWLFGRLDGKQIAEPEKYRGILAPDVTAVCWRRRVFVCARKSPSELQAYLMPKNTPHDKAFLTEALQNPLVTLPAPGHVVMLELAFVGPRVLLFCVSQPCVLHCYVLTREGRHEGTSPSRRDDPGNEIDLSDVPDIDPDLAYPVFNN